MKKPKAKTVISARVTAETKNRLEKRAAREKRSVSALVSAIVEKHA